MCVWWVGSGWWFCGRYQADTAVKPKESNQKEEHTDTAFFRLADLSLRQELFFNIMDKMLKGHFVIFSISPRTNAVK